MNVLTTPTEELNLRLPWSTTCRMACHAVMYNRTWEQQLETALTQGMRKVDQEKRDYKAMVEQNKKGTAPSDD